MLKTIKQIFNNQCPKCEKGKVYEKSFFTLSLKVPKMNSECNVCSNKFTKEPGFFVGAMYVSYGLGVAESLITYFIVSPFFDNNLDLRMIPIIVIVNLLLTFFNLKLSRMIWIYMFRKIA